jgi:site-specific DNA recombinase
MTTGKTISRAVVRQRSAKKAKAKKAASKSIKTTALENEQVGSEAVKAILYCRVSSRQQELEGHGLLSQERRCRDHAIARGYEVVAVSPDTISGGGDFMKRLGMVALLSFVDAQPYESFVVIFDDLKRFARDTRFHLDLRDAFHRRGVRIECLNYHIGNTAEDKFLETIMAAQGELERLQNGRQVAQKMKARMQAGFWIHKAPIGYRFETIKGRGKVLMPHEPFASIVREAIEGFALGRFQTQSEIKRFLETFPEFPRNAQGEVAWQRIADITTQPVYTGHICSETYGLNWLKGQHEPLISLDTIDKVQARRNGTAYAPARKNIGDDFACRGVVVCADCTKPLRSSWPKGKTKSYPYYLYQTLACPQYGKSIPRDKLEGDIGDLIRTLQPTPGLLSVARAMFAAAWDQRKQWLRTVLVSA